MQHPPLPSLGKIPFEPLKFQSSERNSAPRRKNRDLFFRSHYTINYLSLTDLFCICIRTKITRKAEKNTSEGMGKTIFFSPFFIKMFILSRMLSFYTENIYS